MTPPRQLTPPDQVTPPDRHAWDSYYNWWHGGFAAMALLSLVLLPFEDVPASRRWVAAGCVSALIVWYVFVGARALIRDDLRLGVIAAIGTIALVLAGFSADPVVALTLFIAYPQLFAYLQRLRYSVPAVAVLSGGVVVANVARAGWTTEAAAGAAGAGALSLAFAIAFGVWITRIIEQSADRARLIEELQVARDELAAAQHEAGAAAERQRMALEIHDTLAQGFTSIVMLVQAAQAQAGRDEAELGRHLELIERTARENLDEARSLVSQLGPVPLQGAPLAEALDRLSADFSEETSAAAHLVVSGSPRPLDGSSEVVLLRVVQEALNNVRRHARASKVEVELAYSPDCVAVSVRDDGCGFLPAEATGFGLRGMRARVEQAGGDVILDTAPGRGTCVEVRLR